MSFGFGVGEFLTIGQLVLKLYNACNSAPEEFAQLKADLSSLHILLSSLELQAQDPTSLLQRKCGDKRPEWLQIRANLEEALKELQGLVKQYEKMGRNAWQRVQLGLKNLTDLRAKLGIQLHAMNTLFGGIVLGSLGRLEEAQGRMEEQLGKFDTTMTLVARLLLQSVSEERAGRKAPTILSAHGNRNGPEWDRLKIELVVAGVPKDDLEDDSERIMELLDWAVNNGPDLEGLEEMQVHDSVSNAGYRQEVPAQTDIYTQSMVNRKALPAKTHSYPTSHTTSAQSPSLLSIPSSPTSSMQTSFHIQSSTYRGSNSKTARIPIKILIVDDDLTHVGPIFKKYLKNLTAEYLFGPEPPRQCESTVPLDAVPQAWRPNFEIDLCAASPSVTRGPKTPDAINHKYLEKALRKYGKLEFNKNTFQDSKGKRPDLYDYILFVHQYYYRDSPRRDWLQTAPLDDAGASEPILDTQADVDYGDGVTSPYSTIYVGALSTPTKVFEILEFFSKDLKLTKELVWTKHVVLPYPPNFIEKWIPFENRDMYWQASQQIEGGVRRFIQEELRGKQVQQAFPKALPGRPPDHKLESRAAEVSKIAPVILDAESAKPGVETPGYPG